MTSSFGSQVFRWWLSSACTWPAFCTSGSSWEQNASGSRHVPERRREGFVEFVTLRGAGANATVITNNDAIGGLRLASVGDAHTLP